MTVGRVPEALELRTEVPAGASVLYVPVPDSGYWIAEQVSLIYSVTSGPADVVVAVGCERGGADVMLGRAEGSSVAVGTHPLAFLRGVGRRATAGTDDPWPLADVLVGPGGRAYVSISVSAGAAMLTLVELAMRRYHV